MFDFVKNWYCFLIPGLFLLISIPVYGQNTGVVQGIVKDKKTGKPIDAVDVYIDNSTFGTTTDKKGHFRLNHLPSGIFRVIFTSVGYTPAAKHIALGKDGFADFTITLKPKVYNMNKIQVKGKIPKKWKREFREFKRDILGRSEYADQCTFENPQVLSFKRDHKTGALIATTNRRLKLLNLALGYRLFIRLDQFKWKRNDGTYKIHPQFKKLIPSTKEEKAKWKANRRRVYDHSFRHFLYALIHHKASKEGFHYSLGISQLDHQDNMYQLAKRGIYNVTLTGFHIYSQTTVRYKGDTSVIMKTNQDYFFVDSNGDLLNPLSVSLSGAWSNNRLSSLLPFNYHPKN
ncbi:MAG TPA: carboxypeptidase-like regulatory domain-containing protein [Balneolales bacterium]|nr:carboxypeptidase-like regulatory domain-containing protein [Balneolales bacterium]